MKFTVIDKKTGKRPDMEAIAFNEEWAKGLTYCDMEGFFIGEDGGLILADECGNFAYCPADRFEVVEDDGWIPVSERLPEEPYGCLVTVWDCSPTGGEDFENLLPYFVGYDGERWNDGDGQQCPFEVIAWKPLPSPYEEI